MSIYHNRPTVAGIDMLSIEGRFYSPEMREAKVSTYWQTIVKDPSSSWLCC